MSTEPTPTQKAGRKSFSPKIKEKAMRLIAEGELTQKQVADKIGCSINAIQQWKAKYKEMDESAPAFPKKASRKKSKRRGKRLPKNVEVIAVEESRIAFDDFARNFWSENPRAADVLLLPPDITPEAVRYVNDVLLYAYEQLGG